jgi:GT2 family glycosyltransferase/glycosyltransferase involved in cell wall biosynthesis
MKAAPTPQPTNDAEIAVTHAIRSVFDAAWYLERYPDIAAAGIPPILHFVRFGLEEKRDPNPFFEGAWYAEHYPDIGASGIHPLLHYLAAGVAEGRNPHPRFDAEWYVAEHPEAAGNPLLFHLTIGRVRGYRTEKPIAIEDYLPSAIAALPMPPRVFVDVVIPVYRGLQETRHCIESVISDPDRPMGRIIVVDDRSPEPSLSAWLRTLADDGRIYLISNPRNVGFVVSVNTGMEAAGDHDVVLLNSDTEVAPGWLKRLMAHAYAHPRVASVSPLSNNATICSYPRNEGGPIPFGLPVAAIDSLCREANAGRSIRLPTTVGFCMYIPRQALLDVGAFDADRFALGYGEENDFCLRATDRGWQHRLAADVFVYHAGSVSFSERRKKLTERAMELLLERYPDYQEQIAAHVYRNDIASCRFALTAAIFRRSGLPVIMMVCHNLGGGIRRHIGSIMERLAGQAHVLLLAGTHRGATLSVPGLPGHPTLTLPAHRFDDLLSLLRSFAVSRVHIHHLMHIDMDVSGLIRRLGVPFDLTVHDYYAICPQINFLPFRFGHYCGEPDIGGCNACIANRDASGARDIVSWRAERAWQFIDADRILCPSVDLLERLRQRGLGERAILAAHEPVPAAPWAIRLPKLGDTLRIAVIGTLVDHKGARAVASIAETMDPATTEIHLIGHTDGPFSAPALKRMTVTGEYKEAELAALIDEVDPHVIWFPMAWPETYSYTLSAAIAQGCAIAATRIGAFTERLAGRPFTWLTDVPASPATWHAVFEDIRQAIQRKPSDRPSAPVRQPVDDFYAAHYLVARPAAMQTGPWRGTSRPDRSRITIIPELYEPWHPTPCAYIRLLQPLHHPAVTGDAVVRVTDPRNALDYAADVIVTQRSAMESVEAVRALGRHARGIGATLVFDLDDDLVNVPPSHPDAKALRPRAAIVEAMLDVADAVWVSTPALAASIAPLRPDAQVIENALDERLWKVAEPDGPVYDEPVRILAMGTPSHQADFDLILPALTRLKREYGNMVVIDVLGMTAAAVPDGLNRIGPSIHGYRSYPAFVDWLCSVRPQWHIGLAPLLDTPFNRCKSSLKALDYAALGAAVLASDVPVYQESLADGPAGELVGNDPYDWYARLDRWMRHQGERRRLRDGVRLAFLSAGTIAGRAETRRLALRQALHHRQYTESAA